MGRSRSILHGRIWRELVKQWPRFDLEFIFLRFCRGDIQHNYNVQRTPFIIKPSTHSLIYGQLSIIHPSPYLPNHSINTPTNSSFHPCIHLYLCPSIHPYIHPSIPSSIHLSILPFNHLFLLPSIHHPFIHPYLHLFIYLPILPFLLSLPSFLLYSSLPPLFFLHPSFHLAIPPSIHLSIPSSLPFSLHLLSIILSPSLQSYIHFPSSHLFIHLSFFLPIQHVWGPKQIVLFWLCPRSHIM